MIVSPGAWRIPVLQKPIQFVTSLKSKTITCTMSKPQAIMTGVRPTEKPPSTEQGADLNQFTIQWQSIPKRYHRWSIDTHSQASVSLQSYKHIKHSAKYVFAKLKTAKREIGSSVANSELEPEANMATTTKAGLGKDGRIILGAKGEIYRLSDFSVEVFDWVPTAPPDSDTSAETHNALYLIHRMDLTRSPSLNTDPKVPTEVKIVRVFPLFYDRNNGSNLLRMLYIIKTSHNGLGLCLKESNKGEVDIAFQIDSYMDYSSVPVDSEEYFVLFNSKKSILYTFSYQTASLVGQYNVQCLNGHPIFDLKGTFLIYHVDSASNSTISRQNLIPINLSSKNNLLNKLIKTFSNTAMDSLLMFSEVSQNKISRIVEKKQELEHKSTANGEDQNGARNGTGDTPLNGDEDESRLKDTYKQIFVELYNTISRSSSYVELVDLSNKRQLFQLSLPTGCSELSLSPFDLQFLSVSNRGDDIYLWDYTHANDAIVLVDKYCRGKTPAVVQALNWGPGNSSVLCLSKGNGSLHCFLNESLRNYESLKIRKTEHASKQTKMLGQPNRPWCLSSLKLRDFAVVRPLFVSDFVVALDENSSLLKINLETGVIAGYVDLKPLSFSGKGLGHQPHKQNKKVSALLMNREIEVETCKPFLAAYNNTRYKFIEVEVTDIGPPIFSNIESFLTTAKEYNIGKTFHDKAQQQNRREGLDGVPLAEYTATEESPSDIVDSSKTSIETCVRSPSALTPSAALPPKVPSLILAQANIPDSP